MRRGGSRLSDVPDRRSANRGSGATGRRFGAAGFRVARMLTP